MEKAISNKIKFYNFVLTIGIVAYHSRPLTYSAYITDGFDNKIFSRYMAVADYMGSVCMAFFFFMSGFWFYQNISSIQDVKKKCISRFNTLLPPYFLWTIIVFIYNLYTSEMSINDITTNSVCDYLFFNPLDGPLWYLLALLILQIFSPLIFLTKKNKFISISSISIVIIYVALRNSGVIPELLTFDNWWWYNNIFSYLPVYLLGACIGLNYKDLILVKKYNEKQYVFLGIILIVLSAVIMLFYKNSTQYIVFMLCVLTELVGSWFILNLKFFDRKLPSIYDCGFYAYALHSPILIPKTTELFTNVINGRYLNGIELVLVKLLQLLLIVICSYIIKVIFKLILPKRIYNGFSGGRGV